MNFRLLAFLIVLTVLRLVQIGNVGLMPDEAYYHEWSRHLDWWYFSKGPGIAAIMRVSTALFGHSEFGVRFFAPIFALGTTLLVHWLARRMFDARIAFWTVIVMTVSPIFNAGALLMTIDAPSIFFWAASLCTVWLALEKSPAFSWWWPLTGFLTGLGFLCKMTNAAFFASVVLLLAMTPRYRGELLRRGFWSMILAFLPVLAPFLGWNSANGWPTTTHLAARGGLDAAWWNVNPAAFLEFVAFQFGVYSPFIFATMMMALFATIWPSIGRWATAVKRSARALPGTFSSSWVNWILFVILMLVLWMAGNFFEMPLLHRIAAWLAVLIGVLFIGTHKDAANMHWKPRFLAAFAMPLLLAYAWIGLHHKTQPNWTAPAIVSLAILTTPYALDRVLRGVRGTRSFTVAAFALGALMSLIMINTDLVRTLGFPLPYKRDPGARMLGWKEVAEKVAAFREAIETESGQKVFLIANSYGTAAELAFYLPEKRIERPGHPAVYVVESPVAENQFHFRGRYDEFEARNTPVVNDQADSAEYGTNPFAGRTAIFVTDREFETVPPDTLVRTFARWELKTTFEFSRRGLPLRKMNVFLLYRYQPGKMLD